MTHPITPPPELMQQWLEQLYGGPVSYIGPSDRNVVAAIAQWGADQELDACCKWVGAVDGKYGPRLRLARRPKPLSLKEQALEALDRMDQLPTLEDMQVIRRALEQLDD